MERLWGTTWVDAVVTDYDHSRDLHCLTYELGSKVESHEWFNVSSASRDLRPTQRQVFCKGRVLSVCLLQVQPLLLMLARRCFLPQVLV